MITFQDKNIIPLELWHARVGERFLYELESEDFGPAMQNLIGEIQSGTATTQDQQDTKNLKQAAGFTRLVIRGGRAQELLFLKKEILNFEIEIDSAQTLFSAWAGAEVIFRNSAFKNPCLIDLGQTGLKIMHSKNQRYYPRCLDRFPLMKSESIRKLHSSEADSSLVVWINESLRREEGEFHFKFDALCLGLPVEINGFQAKRCTYANLEGDLRVFFKDIAVPQIIFVNDAVLMAAGVKTDHEKTLVLTLGFGVGGALWQK